MPTAAESLTPSSPDDAVKEAISSCISQMAGEHPDWKNEQAIAACYSMANKATGKTNKSKSMRVTGMQGNQ